MAKKCENCEHYKLYTHRELARYMGIMSLSFGLFLFWLPVIGLMLFVIGAALLVGQFAPGAASKHVCLNCKYKD